MFVLWTRTLTHTLLATVLILLFLLIIKLQDDLLGPMPIELVSVKSYLSSKKICSSGTTRQDFPELCISVCAHLCGIQERSVVLDILQYCI